MSHISITIGMPVYNGADYIERALTALSEQTYRHFSLFISDNASTDGTWEILQKWAACDDRIILHRQTTNIGHTENFRYVLAQATTDYFMWHAHDDWLTADYLEELVAIITTEKTCTLACPRLVFLRQDNSLIREVFFPVLLPSSRLERIKTLLTQPSGPRVYGLFHTESLRRAKASIQDFKYIWGWDALVQLPFILNDQMRGSDQAIYYKPIADFSLELYRPATTIKMLRYWLHYLRFHLRFWYASELPVAVKLRCLPWLITHAFNSLELQPVRATIKLIRRPLKRGFKTAKKAFIK